MAIVASERPLDRLHRLFKENQFTAECHKDGVHAVLDCCSEALTNGNPAKIPIIKSCNKIAWRSRAFLAAIRSTGDGSDGSTTIWWTT